MKNLIENFLTTLRRYCIDNYSLYSEQYYEIAKHGKNRIGLGYSDEALYIFPRYVLLNEILNEIERFQAKEFSSLAEAKHFMMVLVNETQTQSAESDKKPIELQAIEEERSSLRKYIEQINEDNISLVEPLFYRRVLTKDEEDKIRKSLISHWELPKKYWYPLTIDKPDNIEAFQDSYFNKEVGAEQLQAILCKHNVKNFYEIREHGASYEMELSVLEPYYNGAEGFWFDENFDWIIYASHESSITIGGWLLPEIQKVWDNWQDRVWDSPFFD